MFFYLYNLLLSIFTITFLPLWAISLKMKGRSVAPYFRRFSREETEKLRDRPVVWIQASSVGETMLAATFLQEFKREFSEWAVVFTCTTQTGHETARRLLTGLADLIGFFPYDHPWVVRRFFRRLQPDVLILIETELWPNVLRQAKKDGVKVFIVNGRLGDRSYKRLKKTGVYGSLLALVDYYCVQSRLDKERFISLGAPAERVAVTGNIKFDQKIVEVSQEKKEEFLRPLNLQRETPVLTAGSTHHGEDEIILSAFAEIKKNLPDALLVLAPRHLERVENIERLLVNFPYQWMKRTRILQGEVASAPIDLLLLDTYGELMLSYALSTVVFVGGSLVPVGGHNLLEAALLSKVVLYGRYMYNFRDSQELLEKVGAGFTVHNAQELSREFLRLANNRELREELGKKARAAVMTNNGATKRTIEILKKQGLSGKI